MGETVIIFGADMGLSVHIDNKNKDILILGERPKQELHETRLTTEAKYLVNFTQLGNATGNATECYRNTSVQSKRVWNKRLYAVLR